jgi:hypothetical protein
MEAMEQHELRGKDHHAGILRVEMAKLRQLDQTKPVEEKEEDQEEVEEDDEEEAMNR